MTEPPSDGRRTSARLKIKDDVFGQQIDGKSKQNGTAKVVKNTTKAAPVAKKRKMDYDEDDGGFKFTRAKAKRRKSTSPVAQEQPIPGTAAPASEQLESQRRYPGVEEPLDDDQVPRRSSRRTSHERIAALSPAKQRNRQRSPQQPKQPQDASATPAESLPSKVSSKIALPFADTPVIRRNKEMRKGNKENRRSSLGMRGRRASSLIDSGTSSALPHDQVETADFYKHIESTLLEPRRMRQLLMWCGARALGEDPSFATEDRPTKLAARQIQQELLKDFAANLSLSNWFSREDSPAKSKTLKPNPRNLANLAKTEELELKLKALREEQSQWTQLQKNPLPETLGLHPLPELSSLSLYSVPPKTTESHPSLQPLLSSSTPTTEAFSTSLSTKLQTLTTNFEQNLDKLLDSVNHLGQHLTSAERLGKKVLGDVATVLEERSKRPLAADGVVGTRDTLRALSRLADQG